MDGWLRTLLTSSDLRRQLCRERGGGGGVGERGREGGKEGGRERGREGKEHINIIYNSNCFTFSFLPLPPDILFPPSLSPHLTEGFLREQ